MQCRFFTHHCLSRAGVVNAALDVLLLLLHRGCDRLCPEGCVFVVPLV